MTLDDLAAWKTKPSWYLVATDERTGLCLARCR
jgi:hypothetical protein